jgi:3-oxoacyl-[acyl-carrier-protein] synthase II
VDRIAISGIGIVSPGAFGREAFLRILSPDGRTDPTFRVPEFAIENHLDNARSFRRVADATKFALASMSLAVTDAGFRAADFGGERVGLVVGVSHGAVTYAVEFHRTLLREGALAASPLFFSESVPNAPAGNGAIAFQIRGPVHTLFGDEKVGTQAIDLASNLLYDGCVDRCLVAGTEEWNEVVAHAYAQMDQVHRNGGDHGDTPALSDGAAALVLELESTVARRKATPHAVIGGWHLGRCLTDSLEDAMADTIRVAFGPTGHLAAEADHVVPPTGRHRGAAMRGVVAARGNAAGPPTWIDLLPVLGNPMGASNLFQVAISAALISKGTMVGPGLAVSTGIQRTLAAAVLSAAKRE